MSAVQRNLYDTDYYAWTLDQANRLRDLAGDNRIDAQNLAEEIEDLGKSELHTVESYVERVIEHLLKVEFSGLYDPINHWQKEIRAFRRRLHKRMTASLRRAVVGDLEECYWQACHAASKTLPETAIDQCLPKDCPYTLEQVLDLDWFPVPKDSGA